MRKIALHSHSQRTYNSRKKADDVENFRLLKALDCDLSDIECLSRFICIRIRANTAMTDRQFLKLIRKFMRFEEWELKAINESYKEEE